MMEGTAKGTRRTLQVVLEKNGRGVRAVYLNDSRIAGGKPWVAEGLSSINVTINEDALMMAIKRERRPTKESA